MSYYIGIDLGGTNIAVGVVDENYSIVSKYSTSTKSQRPYNEIVADMAGAVKIAVEKAGIQLNDCMSIGIGCPGICDKENGVVIYSNNIRWSNVPLRDEMRKYINLPIYISNDANCAALGEVLSGAAVGCSSAIMLTLGTGVGGGIIIDGKIYEGSSSAGAELGHTLIVLGGELCTCGRRGCLEAYVSATGLIRQTRDMAQQNRDSLINELCGNNIDNINGSTAFDAAKKGDIAGKKVVEQYIVYLSEGIIDMVNIFRPEVVILGGGVCNQGEYLLKPVNEYVSKYCFGQNKIPIPPVVKAKLGNDAGIIGAAMLINKTQSL